MQALTTQSAAAATLPAFLAGPAIRNDQALADLLVRADSLRNATLIIFDFFRKTCLHASENITGLCGYPASELRKGGVAFILKITDPTDLPYLKLLQAGYVQEARLPGFNPRSLRFHDYYWSMIGKDASSVPVASTSVVLTYTQEGDLATSIGFHILNDRDCDATIIACKELLRQIKKRHNDVYHHPERCEAPGPYPLNYVSLTTDLITERERQVLGLMAQGCSTLIIADALHIAANTVESHRKKLLLKFAAKNTAELIMKASKVFWLA